MGERKMVPSGMLLTLASIAAVPFEEPRADSAERWLDGRGEKRKRHGKVAANRAKAKAARKARRKSR